MKFLQKNHFRLFTLQSIESYSYFLCIAGGLLRESKSHRNIFLWPSSEQHNGEYAARQKSWTIPRELHFIANQKRPQALCARNPQQTMISSVLMKNFNWQAAKRLVACAGAQFSN
ncbi:MAG: hypothetical protein KDE54_06920 [Caldilineaceae bacterium]|nr:hypothetical protein [Caldilineaceae bacterium]MCB0096613.1 hypothetical protein [Caldilineaceae bacterium]